MAEREHWEDELRRQDLGPHERVRSTAMAAYDEARFRRPARRSPVQRLVRAAAAAAIVAAVFVAGRWSTERPGAPPPSPRETDGDTRPLVAWTATPSDHLRADILDRNTVAQDSLR